VADIQFEAHGSIALMRADSEAGQEWLDDSVDACCAQWWHGAIVVESRFAGDIADGAAHDGLVVAWT
jgi:hypothetical protein